MLRLVYVSTCAAGLQLDDVYDIMRKAHPSNVKDGISGMLCWSGEFFLQCIEGERNAVSRVFSKICGDSRHSNVEILIAAPTRTRWFSEWGMGFSRLLASQPLDLAAGQSEGLNPYLLEALDLESVFEQLSRVAQRLSIES